MIKITVKDLKKDFDRYFCIVQKGEKITVVSEKSIPVLLSPYCDISDSLVGVLANSYDDKEIMKEKYSKNKLMSEDE